MGEEGRKKEEMKEKLEEEGKRKEEMKEVD